jgi:hypothetical protein
MRAAPWKLEASLGICWTQGILDGNLRRTSLYAQALLNKGTKFGMPTGLHGGNGGSLLSGSSGNSSMTADLHNGTHHHRPTPSF